MLNANKELRCGFNPAKLWGREREWQECLPIKFSLVTPTNVGIGCHRFLNFSFNVFTTLV